MVEVVTREELKKGLSEGTITLLDVREPNEYAAGHIPGAKLFPLSAFDPAKLPREEGKRLCFPAVRASGRCGRSKWRNWAAGATPTPITPVR